jgi:hypothetical protein
MIDPYAKCDIKCKVFMDLVLLDYLITIAYFTPFSYLLWVLDNGVRLESGAKTAEIAVSGSDVNQAS